VTAYVGPVLLDTTHDTSGFACGDDVLDGWVRRRALRNQRSGSSRVWVVLDGDERVVAVAAWSTSVVMRSAAPGRLSRDAPDPIPAMLLGRLAVDRRHQGAGLGAALLRQFLLTTVEVSRLTGVRLIVVHATDESAAGFYRHFGFVESVADPLTLLLPVSSLT
jgi:GNAT superfamily N-acetyltransferase